MSFKKWTNYRNFLSLILHISFDFWSVPISISKIQILDPKIQIWTQKSIFRTHNEPNLNRLNKLNELSYFFFVTDSEYRVRFLDQASLDHKLSIFPIKAGKLTGIEKFNDESKLAYAGCWSQKSNQIFHRTQIRLPKISITPIKWLKSIKLKKFHCWLQHRASNEATY